MITMISLMIKWYRNDIINDKNDIEMIKVDTINDKNG